MLVAAFLDAHRDFAVATGKLPGHITPASFELAQDPADAGRRGDHERRDRRAGAPVWPLRLSADRCAAEVGRLECQHQADVAAGGAEDSCKAAEEKECLNDVSCIRLRPERPNHIWSYRLVEDRTHDGRKHRMLNLIDEFTRECSAIRIDPKLTLTAVIDVLSEMFLLRNARD